MGNSISTNSSLAPISEASTIIGFVSFAFTLGTFIRVFWENLTTIAQASTQARDQLGNTKQALYEERAHLLRIRRECRGEYDQGAFRLLFDAVDNMCQQMQELERPFLDPKAKDENAAAGSKRQSQTQGRRSGRENGRRSRGTDDVPGSTRFYEDKHGRKRVKRAREELEDGVRDYTYTSERKGPRSSGQRHRGSRSDDEDEDVSGRPLEVMPAEYFETSYRSLNLRERVAWVRTKASVQELSDQLAHIQTRRIARQMTSLFVQINYVSQHVGDLAGRLDDIESSLERGSGVAPSQYRANDPRRG